MVDVLVPALDALQAALGEGAGFGDALARASDAAAEGMRSTIPMVARKGRASYLGDRSAGHQDPGATSARLLMQAAAETLARPAEGL
jgi:dihydroxyacetone kinase-like protein